MTQSPERVRALAAEFGQSHLFRFWPELGSRERAELLDDIGQIDFARCQPLIERYVRRKPESMPGGVIGPAKIYPASPGIEFADTYRRAGEAGAEAIRRGEVAAFMVAGGQGTRLGFEGPKGTFPISPVRNATLFQWFAEGLRGVQRRYGRALNWYIMTSPQNDADTQQYFERQSFFGLQRSQVHFFIQGQMPAFHLDGRIAMASKSRLALSPDGHGGSLRALRVSGALERMRETGVNYISYFQVDNPLVQSVDPLFIGLHVLTGSEMSSKAVEKVADRERVGNFCTVDGKPQIIEYSDLPDALADAKNADGSRKFNAGSIAIHVLSREFVESVTTPGAALELPWHRADKAMAVIDESGEVLKPAAPNVVKLEMFVFDAIPLAKNPLVLYTPREEEFSPVKNADGADSPATTRRDLLRRATRWLRAARVDVPCIAGDDPAQPVEISPAFALDQADLRERLAGSRIDLGRPILLE